jgi:hypothetical protein
MTNYRLGRNVVHDPRSRAFPFKSDKALVSAKHVRRIAVLDQGDLGSCTGNATVGALGTEPFYDTLSDKGLAFDENMAIDIYSKATAVDNFPGTYPPTDTGSAGIYVAQVAKTLGYISGYTHAFDTNTALQAIVDHPVIVGINWYENFFYPDANGVVSKARRDYVAGGHEICADEIDVERQLVGFTNSWGTGWGLQGRFYMGFDLFSSLLAEDGDVTVFVPITVPAPTPVDPTPTPVDPTPPTPIDPIDQTCWDKVKAWAGMSHRGENRKAATAVKQWAADKGLDTM